jgi:LPP20 lipoprotein
MSFGSPRSLFTIAACSFFCSFSAAYAQTDPCSTLADLQSKGDSSLFVGYGTGSSQKEADQNAQVDLARNIRQKVTATSTVDETKNDATLQSTSKSVVSEILIGAKVLKRCPNGSSFSSVVTLEKNTFISSLTEKLSSNIKKANNLKSSIENAKSDEILGQSIDSAKKFLADYQESSEADFELCKVYKGCADIKVDNSFHDLAELVSKEGDKDQYVLVTDNDKVSAALRDDLITLLEADNIKIMDGAVSENSKESKRKILASCKAKVGSKIPGTDDRVVETRCTVEAYIGKQKKFRKVYSCKAMGDAGISIEDAVTSCSGRLQLE